MAETTLYLDGNTSSGLDENTVLELTIVLPCLNEVETLAICIEKAKDAISACKITGEVIVADNGSTDGSPEVALAHGARVISVPTRGYGSALHAGIQAARGRYILIADSDDSYEFTHLPRFLAELRSGAELVVGNRFRGGIEPGAMPFLHKHLGNPLLSFIGRFLFHIPVHDVHCGMRAFSGEAYQRLNLRTTGMEFASEMIVKASLCRQRIAEVPTILKKDGRSRPPHLRTWRDGWRHLRFLLMYSPRWLFLVPGLLLMMVGTALMLWLLPSERPFGQLNLGIDTLAYSIASVLIGFQLAFFGIAAKVFATTEGLIPRDPGFENWFRYITLEVGLVVGVLLLLIGFTLAIVSGIMWSHTGYGPLSPIVMMRRTLPAVLCLTLGTEICFSSFFLSILGLSRR
jgi:glycosyltransferase involved in cell wall biosynthesis